MKNKRVKDDRVQLSVEGAQPESAPQDASIDKLIHLALPVRLVHMQNGERGGMELACTYDIHPRGARILSCHDVKVGDFVTVERGRNKSVCRVVWTANPTSALRGQFTVECVEGSRTPWEEELRQMEEQYLPLVPDKSIPRPTMSLMSKGLQNRRRSPRFPIEGGADLSAIDGRSRIEGRLNEISEFGCLITASDLPEAGTNLRLVLNMCDVSVALRGHVKYTAKSRSMGVEFQEIRQGDRPLLNYVLNQLKKPRNEDFADLEVITENLTAIAG